MLKKLAVLNELERKSKKANFLLAGEAMTGWEGFKNKTMEGWCWETSNFIAALLSDNDRVVRGRLANINGAGYNYFHGWIEVERFKDDFVFDPALGVFRTKKEYYGELTPNIAGQTSAGEIKKALIDKWAQTPRGKLSWCKSGKEYVSLVGGNDANAPIFRGSYSYSLELDKKDEINGFETLCYLNG